MKGSSKIDVIAAKRPFTAYSGEDVDRLLLSCTLYIVTNYLLSRVRLDSMTPISKGPHCKATSRAKRVLEGSKHSETSDVRTERIR
jgi:glutamate racemase